MNCPKHGLETCGNNLKISCDDFQTKMLHNIPLDVWTHIVEYFTKLDLSNLQAYMKWNCNDYDRLKLHRLEQLENRIQSKRGVSLDRLEKVFHSIEEEINDKIQCSIEYTESLGFPVTFMDPKVVEYFSKLFRFQMESRLMIEYIHSTIYMMAKRNPNITLERMDIMIENDNAEEDDISFDLVDNIENSIDGRFNLVASKNVDKFKFGGLWE